MQNGKAAAEAPGGDEAFSLYIRARAYDVRWLRDVLRASDRAQRAVMREDRPPIKLVRVWAEKEGLQKALERLEMWTNDER